MPSARAIALLLGPVVGLTLLAATGPAPAPAPIVRFTDVTAAAGIDFVHRHGGTGRKYYIETVPPGACWIDFDGHTP